MRKTWASAVLVAALGVAVLATACGGDPVKAIRASATQAVPTTTTAVVPETTTSTTAVPTTTTSTTLAPTTSTTGPPATSTTLRPTTTTPPLPTPTTRSPGDTRRAVGWDTYAVSSDGRTLTFSYTSGPPPCSIADGIQSEETSATVRVTVYERDGSGGQPCIAIAQFKSATVTLASPLGGRRVVDGARS